MKDVEIRNKKLFISFRKMRKPKEELFPSTLLITPELLPTSSASRKADSLLKNSDCVGEVVYV